VKKSVLDYILKVRLPVTVFVMAMAFALTYYVSRPERDYLGYSPDQPINFSHKLHAGNMKIDCQYCHTAVEKGRHAGIPSADICMNCHSVARKDRPEIKKLTKYYEQNKPIPWKRVHRVPEFAYFNHSFHVNKGIDCKHCHGEVGQMDKIAQVHSFTMGRCLYCHRNPYERMPELKGVVNRGRTDCWACHR
jgi:hypothetical protein